MTNPPRSFLWNEDRIPELLPHSDVKHRLLREYLQRYFSILLNVPIREKLRLTLFDGFAGGGEFLHKGELRSGTPLIFAEETLRALEAHCSERNVEFDITLDLVEKHEATYRVLEDTVRTQDYFGSFPGKINFYNDDYLNVLPKVIDRLKAVQNSTHRSIFFLDQTGFSQVPLDIIRRIMTELRNPEVILTFSVSWLADLATSTPDFLSKVSALGIDDERLKDMLSESEKSKRYSAQKWLRAYIADYVGASFNTCFFLKSRPANKDIWLLHFANQWRARDAMLDAHYALANNAHFYGKAGFDMLGFDQYVDPEQFNLFGFSKEDEFDSVNFVQSDVPRKLTDQYRLRPVNIVDFFYENMNDATLTFEQYQRGLCLARDNGIIEVLSAKGNERRRAKYFGKSDRIIIPRQRKFWDFST